jgi:hypothetical protein
MKASGRAPRSSRALIRVLRNRSPGALERLASLIDPAKIVIGGKSDPEQRYIDPTGELRDRELLRQIWLRLDDTCQIDPDLTSRCQYRSSSSAVHAGKGRGTQPTVGLLIA